MNPTEIPHQIPESTRLQTGINRGAFFYNTLMKHTARYPSSAQLDITLIGLGRVAHDLHCIYAPYRLIHDVLALGRPCTVTLVDPRPDVIDQFLTQRHLYVSQSALDMPRLRNQWQPHIEEYAQAFHGSWTRVRTAQPDLHFSASTQADTCLAQGVYQLPIPQEVLEFIRSPHCTTVVGAYETMPPRSSSALELMNVLYQLNRKTQNACLRQVSHSLTPKGFCVLNDVCDVPGCTPLFADRGGWLNKSDLPDLFGLRIDQCLDSTPNHEVFVLKRVEQR